MNGSGVHGPISGDGTGSLGPHSGTFAPPHVLSTQPDPVALPLPSRADCRCPCHHTPGVVHIAPCCREEIRTTVDFRLLQQLAQQLDLPTRDPDKVIAKAVEALDATHELIAALNGNGMKV